jgi:hypothetical protein
MQGAVKSANTQLQGTACVPLGEESEQVIHLEFLDRT